MENGIDTLAGMELNAERDALKLQLIDALLAAAEWNFAFGGDSITISGLVDPVALSVPLARLDAMKESAAR